MDTLEALQKELELLRMDIIYLDKRIEVLKESLNLLSRDDPDYFNISSQIQKDEIQKNEITVYKENIIKKIKELEK